MKKSQLFILLILVGCSAENKIMSNNSNVNVGITLISSSSPQLIIYKTRENYNNLIPVLLSDDKTQIISYPHPKDIKIGDELQFPTLLNKEYLIDNRGITRNVAFLKITYDEYSKLENVPSLEYLYSMIVDKNPLIEYYNCGLRSEYKDKIQLLNQMIDNGELKAICNK
jgi:hypothetical protein